MKKRSRIILMSIISAIVLLTSAFFLYVSDYYKAENPAVDMMKEADNIEVRDNLTIISPESPGDTALIFYPGAKVEHIAYIPMLEKLSKKRYQMRTCEDAFQYGYIFS